MDEFYCPINGSQGHDLIRSAEESSAEREIFNCLCGYSKTEHNDCGSGG